MKISIVSFSDSMGGAARAAYRLHQSLNKSKLIKCEMLVKKKHTDDDSVITESSKIKKFKDKVSNRISMLLVKLQKSKNRTLHSLNIFGSSVFGLVKKSHSDIVNIHWVNYETLSLKQISKIQQPIVLTLHDMWAFCGTEHLSIDSKSSDFRRGYNNCMVDSDFLSGINLNKYIWNKKIKYFQEDITVVCPSHWLANCARESEIFKNSDIHVIPNPLNIEVFKPMDNELAKKSLNLPLNKKLIGFGAMGGCVDPNKGFDLLLKALGELENKHDYMCIIFGQSEPSTPLDITIEQIYLGHIYDDETLTLFYNAIDVMVVPSRQENLPQTATESQACGTPVVAFNTTGFPDVIEHKVTGYLANAFDSNDLAAGIKWCIDNSILCDLNKNCRCKAIREWSESTIADKYIKVYQALC